ncbi:MAG: hypothetical protein GYA15_09055 [Leptolinea sp.]|jgi:CRISPR-associated protein (TIGR02584 family)|nr:hypothetical protein [Leptolinea sp.]
MESCLIATLGTEAQVVTTVLDCLLAAKSEISFVNIIHTSTPNDLILSALEKLRKETSGYPGYQKITFIFSPIELPSGERIDDLDSIAAGQAGFHLLYRVIFEAKQNNLQVFLCISGGRKNLSLFGMSAAQLLFNDEDKLVHLYSSHEFLNSKEMHPRNEKDANMVEIPVLLWSSISPAHLLLYDSVDPLRAIEKYKNIHLEERIETGRIFLLSILTPAEQQVVEILVGGGLTDREISQILHISERTVESHIKSARMKAEDFFRLSSINRTGLVALLQPAVIFIKGGKFRENPDVSTITMK